MKKTIVALALVATGTSALAWGDREQGILAGIAGTLFLQHLQRQQQQPPVVVQQPQVIQQPPIVSSNGGVVTDRPLNCSSRPILFDQHTGRPIQFETTCR